MKKSVKERKKRTKLKLKLAFSYSSSPFFHFLCFHHHHSLPSLSLSEWSWENDVVEHQKTKSNTPPFLLFHLCVDVLTKNLGFLCCNCGKNPIFLLFCDCCEEKIQPHKEKNELGSSGVFSRKSWWADCSAYAVQALIWTRGEIFSFVYLIFFCCCFFNFLGFCISCCLLEGFFDHSYVFCWFILWYGELIWEFVCFFVHFLFESWGLVCFEGWCGNSLNPNGFEEDSYG